MNIVKNKKTVINLNIYIKLFIIKDLLKILYINF